MIRHPIRADEYRARAVAETAAGAASGLDHVRAKHQRAAQVWIGLAEGEDARAGLREARLAKLGALHPGGRTPADLTVA